MEPPVSDAFSWTCPTCGTHTSITTPHVHRGAVNIATQKTPQNRGVKLGFQLIECPNPNCKAPNFQVNAFYSSEWGRGANGIYMASDLERPVGIGTCTFVPTTTHPLSQHVPAQVAEDYNEAFLIKSLSPKASATLARRALQGMVRDFFQVRNKQTLHAELEAIEDKCDVALYAAMMAVKSVGNIGAHPEKDVSLMVDVDPGEAETLLDLIHLLDQEWYVARAERAERIAKMQALGTAKKQAQKPTQPAPQV